MRTNSKPPTPPKPASLAPLLFAPLLVALSPLPWAQVGVHPSADPPPRDELLRLYRAAELPALAEDQLAAIVSSYGPASVDDDDSLNLTVEALAALYAASGGSLPAERAWVPRDGLEYLLASSARLPDRGAQVLGQTGFWLFYTSGPESHELVLRTARALPADNAYVPYLYSALVEAALDSKSFRSASELVEEVLERLPTDEAFAAAHSHFEGARGQVLYNLGVPDRAAALVRADLEFQRALVEAGSGNPNWVRHALVRVTTIQHLTGRYDELLAEIDAAPAAERSPELRYRAMRARLARALTNETPPEEWSRLAEEIEEHISGATTTVQRIRGGLLACRVAMLRLDWDRAAERLTTARALLDDAGDSGSLAAERRSAAVLRCRLAEHGGETRERLAAASALGTTFESMLASWHAAPTRGAGTGLLEDDLARLVISARMRVEASGPDGPRRALELLERARHAASPLLRDLGGMPAKVDAAQRWLLPEGGGALVFFSLLFEPSPVFAVDATGVRLAYASPWSEMVGPAREFCALTQRPPGTERASTAARRDALREHGEHLVRGLVPEEFRELVSGWRHVSLVGTDLLGQPVPLDLLPWSGRPLGVEKATAYLPSLSLGLALVERAGLRSGPRSGKPWDAVLVGGVLPGPSALAAHPHATELRLTPEQEARLHAAFDGRRTIQLVGAEATGAALAAAPLADATYLHVLAHGVRDLTRERPASLVLSAEAASDGILRSADVERLRSPAVVLLPACGAGRGPAREGDGGSSDFSGAFLRAGADTVVSARTELAVGPTVELVTRFHESLVRGVPTAEALRRARADLYRWEDYRDPFYLSTLRVDGLGHQPTFEAPSARAPWAFGASAGALGLLVWAWVRSKRRDHSASRRAPGARTISG